MDPGPGERPTIADPLGKTFTCWGYTFQWTADHHTPEDVEHLRHSFDELGDAALDRLDALCPKQEAAAGAPAKQQRRDLYALLRDQQASDPVLAELWRSANEVPDWVDWDQIQRGQDVFYRYRGANLTGLAFQSLLGGMVSGPLSLVLSTFICICTCIYLRIRVSLLSFPRVQNSPRHATTSRSHVHISLSSRPPSMIQPHSLESTFHTQQLFPAECSSIQ